MKRLLCAWAVLTVVLATFLYMSVRKYQGLKESVQTQIENVRAEYAPLVRQTVRDTVSVADHSIYTANHSEVREKLRDKHLLKDLGLSQRQVNSVQTTSLMTSISVTLPGQRDTSLVDSVVFPKTWSFHDDWTDIEISDSTLSVSVKDSVSTVVYREYKHRFLWWKWGTKSVRVKIVNFNPHSVIKYDEYVNVKN